MPNLLRMTPALTVTAAFLALGCGDATGPDAEYFTGTLCGVQWSASTEEEFPMAALSDSTLGLIGAYGDAIEVKSLGILNVPAEVGTYYVGNAVLGEEPSAMILVSRGTLGSDDFSSWAYRSDSGSVTITSLDANRVSGTFGIRFGLASFEAPGPCGGISSGEFRLDIFR